MTFTATENGKKVLTMAEYIEREALLREIERREALMVGDKLVSVDAMKSFIKNRQAADVAPVRHARWEEADWVEPDCHGFGIIRTPKAALRCSNCKNCFKKELLWKDNYCPNCGAKMNLEG